MAQLGAAIRIVVGLSVLGFAATLQTMILLLLLPSRIARIRSCVVFERLVGYPCAWLSGCYLTVSGKEHLDGRRPAIYVLNHTSAADLFIALRLMPGSAVGIVKKEIVRYPFFGQMYLLTGHLRVDRSNRDAAVVSMQALGKLVRRHKLSIIMAPEGTRSRDSRLLPIKKGLVHLALQTGLPVVPIVVQGAHKAWRSDSLAVLGAQVRVDVLPAVSTSHWTEETTDEAAKEIHAIFSRALPPDQKPLATAEG